MPDNTKRHIIGDENEAPPKQSPIVLYEDGTKPIYDVYWKFQPKKVRGVPNGNAMCPEKQLRMLIDKKEFGNVMNKKINELNGISRYSDMYTRLYDPEGSKEERLAHDYNIRYNMDFTTDDFGKLYSHFMMMKNKELEETDEFIEPTKTYTPEEDMSSNGLFTYVPKIDQDAYMKYLDSIRTDRVSVTG